MRTILEFSYSSNFSNFCEYRQNAYFGGKT